MYTKKILRFILIPFIFILFLFNITEAEDSSAKKLGVDHFSVKLSPESAKVGELVDLEIKAVDKNDNIITDYDLPVLIFSKTDPEVELPIGLDNNTYTFTKANQGEIKFENGIGFSKKGVHDLYIYDFEDDSIFGVAEINVSEGDKASKIPIDIISPENGLVIPKNEIKISGSTNKNHKVIVKVNSKEYETTSNSNGVYELEASSLENGENIIKAKVLDADKKVAGESKEVKIKVDDSNIVLKKVKLIPEEVFTNSIYEIEAIATKNLEKFDIIVNDEIVPLKEKEDGTYIGKTYAPADKGSYNLDATLKDQLGHELKQYGVATLKVKELNSGSGKVEKKREITEISIKQQVGNLDPLEITGLKLVELKTKSILTWDKLEKAKGYKIFKKNKDGVFEFVREVKEPRFEVIIDKSKKEITYDYFAVKAMGETPSGEKYEGNLSEATKIKTGPEMIILIIISIIIGISLSLFFFRKTKS